MNMATLSNSPHGYKFYMQECDKKGNLLANTTAKNLESDFEGLRYSKMEGIEATGEPKNIYTEEFTDSQRLRVFVPETICNKNTSITFTCYIFGENRHSVYDAFNAYIQSGFHRYWDTARNKYFVFFVNAAIKPEEDEWNGIGYLEVVYTLTNIYGKTFNVGDPIPTE